MILLIEEFPLNLFKDWIRNEKNELLMDNRDLKKEMEKRKTNKIYDRVWKKKLKRIN